MGRKKRKVDKLICPICGCELWEIESNVFRCFLCKRPYFGKKLLTGRNIFSMNKKLEFLAKYIEE